MRFQSAFVLSLGLALACGDPAPKEASSGDGVTFTAIKDDGPPVDVWDGSKPYECTGNADKRLKDLKLDNLAHDPAITATGNCKLVLENVDISAVRPLEAKGNASVKVIGGRLKGTSTAVTATGNSKVVIEGATLDGGIEKLGRATVDQGGGAAKASSSGSGATAAAKPAAGKPTPRADGTVCCERGEEGMMEDEGKLFNQRWAFEPAAECSNDFTAGLAYANPVDESKCNSSKNDSVGVVDSSKANGEGTCCCQYQEKDADGFPKTVYRVVPEFDCSEDRGEVCMIAGDHCDN